MSDSHSPALHHHFEDLGQQYEASNMGMWAFIAQEIMFFGGLFGGYAVYRYQYYDAFVEGSHHLPIEWGALNTVVLIGSSLTVALAVRSAQQGKQMAIFNWIVATMILGAVFLGVKTIEYSHKFHDGLIPGSSFLTHGPYTTAYDAAMAGHLKIFFSFYFVMTGMHALHMVIGIGIALFQFSDWLPIFVVAIIFLFGQSLESYVLTPKLVGDRVGLHPVWIIFSLLAGGSIFGFTGVLLAVPLAAVIGVLLRFSLARYLESPLYYGQHNNNRDSGE